MVTVRRTAAALILGFLPIVFAAPVSAATAPLVSVSGFTHDPSGQALSGVEILVLSEPGAGVAVAHALSDDRGRFVLAALDPGVYRVAAVKSGYIAALGVVNTLLKSSVDLILRPIPKPGEPGAERVTKDMSWALRLPPRSILREVEASVGTDDEGQGGPGNLVSRVSDSLRGHVDHVVAMGSWQPDAHGPASNLEGAETRMRLSGSLGERGSIQVAGRRDSFDSSSPREAPAVKRLAAGVDVDVNYDTSDDGSLAMSAFYSKGDLELGGLPAQGKGPSRQAQRSWGYDATWKRQVDDGSQLAVQVGYHDASLDVPDAGTLFDSPARDASNRGIGAEGSYESFVGDGHVVRVGLRAQRLFLAAPDARLARAGGSFPLDGSDGWSVLVDAQDAWTLAAAWAFDYGLAVRQSFNGPLATTYVTPRVGGSWTTARLRAHAEISYVAANRSPDADVLAPWRAGVSPVGYQLDVAAPLSATVSLRGTTAFVPLEAGRWSGGIVPGGVGNVYVSDGTASDRFVAFGLERSAATANLSLTVARGRAEGAIAPAFEDELPVVLLENRTMVYEAVRFGARAPRSGSNLAVEYRSFHEGSAGVDDPMASGALRTVDLEFAQDLVRFGGGRATCRLIVMARTVIDPPEASSTPSEREEARNFAALNRRLGAGVSLAF